MNHSSEHVELGVAPASLGLSARHGSQSEPRMIQSQLPSVRGTNSQIYEISNRNIQELESF